MKDFVRSLNRELTVLQQEEALLEKELQHVRRRQDKVRKLKGLYTGVNILADELEPVEGASIALSEAEMIQRVKENAGEGVDAGRDSGTCASRFWGEDCGGVMGGIMPEQLEQALREEAEALDNSIQQTRQDIELLRKRRHSLEQLFKTCATRNEET